MHAMDIRIFGGPIKAGLLLEGVFDIRRGEDGFLLGHRVPDRLAVGIQADGLFDGRYTLYGFQVLPLDPPVIAANEESWAVRTAFDPEHPSPYIMELCAGFGGMGIGSSFLGGQTLISVDINELAIGHLRQITNNKQVKMDINAQDAPFRIHQVTQGSAPTATMGFPCQPYSEQGHRLGTLDPRSKTLWGGLRVIFMTQCQSAILECVPRAGRHPEVQKAIHSLASAMGWVVLQSDLELAHQWPSRRRRWWAILMPASWQTTGFSTWPSHSPYLNVGTIFGHFTHWDDHDEMDLRLNQTEINKFGDRAYGNDKRKLEANDVAAALLHSYANGTSPCPCHCRLQAFSETSLRSKGLRGYYIQVEADEPPRFLHHREAALLLGVPDDLIYTHTPRENLCLLGLIASPIQMVYVYSTLLFNCAHTTTNQPVLHPLNAVRMYQTRLLQLWQKQVPRPISLIHHLSNEQDDMGPYGTAALLPLEARQLCHAERINAEWGSKQSLWEINHERQPSYIPTPLHNQLRTDALYKTTSTAKKQRTSPPMEAILITLTHFQHTMTTAIYPGQFIFEALRKCRSR